METATFITFVNIWTAVEFDWLRSAGPPFAGR
jgi:hypothetical protein